jgi:peptidyl-prolyl cis-trans isomerase C
MKQVCMALLVACASYGCAQAQRTPPARRPMTVSRPAATNAKTAHARHILVKDRATAETIRKQLTQGADFAMLARKHSLCPSKSNGGDLGTFTPGRMVPEFDAASFSQPVKAFTVVQTKFGYHVLQVLERN